MIKETSALPEGLRPFAAGRIAEVFAWDNGRVLKLFREPYPVSWVESEAAVTAAAHAAGAPAPAVLGVLEVNGRWGILFERIEGPSLLAELTRAPLRIGRAGRTLAELHAALHARAAAGLPDQRERLAQAIRSAARLSESQRAAALRALDARPSGQALCHMDFHPDNILISAAGPRIIDWMTACAGNPWADVARTTLMLLVGDPPPGAPLARLIVLGRAWLRSAYLRRYRALRPDPTGELQAWLPILAAARLNEDIPSETERVLAIVRRAYGF